MKNKNNINNEKIIKINRVMKVVRGRRVMNFVVLSVVGDKNGGIGFGKGKSREILLAKKKSIYKAYKKFQKIPLNNGTIFYKIIGKYGASSVLMSPANKGTGIISCLSIRYVFSVMGITDIIAKSNGSNNPHNIIKATLNGLLNMNTPEEIMKKRNIYI